MLRPCLLITVALLGLHCVGNTTVIRLEDGTEVITAGEGVSIGPYRKKFNGRLIGASATGNEPLQHARFLDHFDEHEPPLVLDITLDSSGRFSSELILPACGSGRLRYVLPKRITIEAPGCTSVTIEVDDRWKRKTITLRCDSPSTGSSRRARTAHQGQ